MLEPAVVLLRFIQYVGAATLFGTPLLFLYALGRHGPDFVDGARWPRPLVAGSALLLLAGSTFGLIAQTALMAGSWAEGLKAASLTYVATDTGLGRAALARAACAVAALAVLAAMRPRARLWGLTASVGGLACASFAWMGHGAATEGAVGMAHLASDMVHSLAGAAWIGALVGFSALLRPARPSLGESRAIFNALHGFSGFGSALVGLLIATGAVNSWFLVGPEDIDGLWTTPYGRLLSAKLALFMGMLGLAAANRWRLTPALARAVSTGGDPSRALKALRQSVIFETALAGVVLALVAWLGTMAPPSSR